MAKDSLQQTWFKALGASITDLAVDSTGAVWAGSLTGKLIKITSEGILSEPIQLDNPIYSVSVDESDCVYVGDSANNLYKYTSTGELKWGKNLGEGNADTIPLVSTINKEKPDENGNINLGKTYYSQSEINSFLEPLGRTKSVNGVVPNKAGNVVLDFSGYFAYKGVVNTADFDKSLDKGWYVNHDDSGANNTLLVYANDDIVQQILIGADYSIKLRTKKDGSFNDWHTLTNNVKAINGIKPDKSGNVTLDLTGNIKTVNNLKPDENGNIQLGAGSANSVKSINTDNKPDDTGNVTVPTFSPNLLTGTSIRKKIIPPKTVNDSVNLWDSKPISTYAGVLSSGTESAEQPNLGSRLVDSIPVMGGDSYSYSFDISTKANTVDMGLSSAYNNYTLWRKPKFVINVVFLDNNNNVVSSIPKKYVMESKNGYSAILVSDTFVVPARATKVEIWYNGLEDTVPNLVIGKDGSYVAFCSEQNDLDQMIDLPTMNLVRNISGKRIRVKLQANITNYKKGDIFTIKTKDVNDLFFKSDNSKLDSDKSLIKPVDGLDTNNLITGNGFYSWEYTLNADDLVTNAPQSIIPVTNVVGNIDYTVKLVVLDSLDDNPDMEWTSAIYDKDGVKYLNSAFNTLNFWYGKIYANKSRNEINLGSYSLKNNYIALSDTKGKYSASAHVDMLSSQGAYQLMLRKVDSNGNVKAEKLSDLKPNVIKDINNTVTVDDNPLIKVEGLENNNPLDTETINVSLLVFGQTADISVSQVKLAQWKDGGKTPPDLTWLPSTEDTVGINSINNKFPDDKGNFTLSDFEHPDFVYMPNQEFDIDKATTAGIYYLKDAKVIASYRKDCLDGLPKTTDGTTMFGYLVVRVHDEWNIDQFLILNTGMETPDLVLATRSVTSVNQFRPKFRKILNIDDFNKLYQAIPSFQRPDFDKTNLIVDVDNLYEPGIYNLNNTTLQCSINNKALVNVPAGDRTINSQSYYGFIIVSTQAGGKQVFQTIISRSNIAESSNNDYTIAIRLVRPSTNDRMVFQKLLNTEDYSTLDDKINGLNTIVNPKVIDNKSVPKITTPGLYLIKPDSNSSSSSDTPPYSDLFNRSYEMYLFIPKQDLNHTMAGTNNLLQVMFQISTEPQVDKYNYDGNTIHSWYRIVNTEKGFSTAWLSKDLIISTARSDIYNLKQSYNSLNDRMNTKLDTWVGTLAEYQALDTIKPLTIYYIVSDYEVVVK